MSTSEERPPRPTDAPVLDAPSPGWFRRARAFPVSSHHVEVTGCDIHYLRWNATSGGTNKPGLLLLHGGGAHANWWRAIAPLLATDFDIAAMDLSGMGDSGHRPEYNATIRAAEIDAVLTAAGFFAADRPAPVLVGHSFGGLSGIRYAALHSAKLGGFIMAETPVRPRTERRPTSAPPVDAAEVRRYASYTQALARFRLRPPQSCVNSFVVEHVARHSIRRLDEGWSWKFDPAALTAKRHAEPFTEYLSNITCRCALVVGEKSALWTPGITSHMLDTLQVDAPVMAIPEGQHHLILDEPVAFVIAVRGLLATHFT